MLKSTSLSEQKAVISKKLRSDRFAVMTGQEDDFAQRQGEIRAMYDQVDDLETRIVAELDKEDTEAQAAMARTADTSGWTPELREVREVAQRASIADYVAAATEERHVTGAAKEYNEHVFGTYAQGDYPLEFLLDRDELLDLKPEQVAAMQAGSAEERAVITGIAATHGNPTFVDRLLATSDAAYCMARFPAVGPGRHSYPIVSGTTVAADYARGAAETPAGGLTIKDADPGRIQHSYEYAAADELQIPGVANGLASDLRMSLQAGLDAKVITDLIAGLPAVSIVSADPVTLSNLFTMWGRVVDGRGARNVNEVRWLVGAGSGATNAYGVILGGSISNVTAAFLAIPHDRFRGTSHIAAANPQIGLAIRTGRGPDRLLVPIWRRGTLLRDPNTQQLKGNIVLTGVMYADVIVVNGDQHEKVTINTA